MLAKPAPRPSEWASQARPRPAASPPSMPAQGLRAVAAPAAPAVLAALVAWLGVAGVAWRWVTLLDWRPKEPPPPMRLASASKVKAPTRNTASSTVIRRDRN